MQNKTKTYHYNRVYLYFNGISYRREELPDTVRLEILESIKKEFLASISEFYNIVNRKIDNFKIEIGDSSSHQAKE